MKNRFSRISLASILTMAFVVCANVAAFAQHPVFSGDWKLDETKSELGEFGGRMVAKTVKVEQKADAISFAKTSPGFNGGDPVTTTLLLPFDGKQVESEGFGGSKRKSTAKWSDDRQSLIVNSTTLFERNGQSMEIKATETWSLKDGSLYVVTTSSSPRGETTTKALYTK